VSVPEREYGLGDPGTPKKPPRVKSVLGEVELYDKLLKILADPKGGVAQQMAVKLIEEAKRGGSKPGEPRPYCPNCGCAALSEIAVKVEPQGLHKMLMGEAATGYGTYLGCPACPWASPMIVVPRRSS